MATSIWGKKPTLEGLNAFSAGTMVAHLGIEFIEVGDDFITARMPVDARTVQPYGILHGGASVALAETLGSSASVFCMDMETQYGVGIEINANHIRSVTEGYVVGTARPIHIGRRTHVWDIQIKNEAGKLVCISRLTVAVLTQ